MDRILIILKKENGPRASSAPALGLNTIIFEYVYWYVKQISGERLQDHWSSGFVWDKNVKILLTIPKILIRLHEIDQYEVKMLNRKIKLPYLNA